MIGILGILAIILSACNNIPRTGSLDKNSDSKDSNNREEPNQEESQLNQDEEDRIHAKLPEDYELIRMNYTYNEIQAFYPQLTTEAGSGIQKEINNIIQKDVNDIIKIYADTVETSVEIGETESHEFVLTIDYEIKLHNSKYLSIYYTADYSSKTAAYPFQMVYTTNIDMLNGYRLVLGDMVLLDDNFVNSFKTWDFTVVEEDNKDLKEAVSESFADLNNEMLLKAMKNADLIGKANTMGVFSYLTKDKLGISISVPHALGDHVQFEQKYNKLKEFLTTDVED
jgi:hypothetical protein